MASRSAWTARAGTWTTSLSSGCGAVSNTRRSTSMPMRLSPKPRLVLASGWTFTTPSASIRVWVIARRVRSTRTAYGYVDDRRRRPAALPPLPEPARKAGKCSPSPTYPQAPLPTTDVIDEVNSRRGKPAVPPATGAGIETDRAHLKKQLRLAHKRGAPQAAPLFEPDVIEITDAGGVRVVAVPKHGDMNQMRRRRIL